MNDQHTFQAPASQRRAVREIAMAIACVCMAFSSLVFSQEEAGHPTFMSPHAAPIALGSGRVYVANTPADTLDVIDGTTLEIVARVDVGIDPVAVAVRPDGMEVWVANHVSDSVSVVDADPESASYLQVIATIQNINSATRGTLFDEPVGVAFASNEKAYVALSSTNRIAVVDVAGKAVTGSFGITAQDPRAITVRGDRLYVIPFESGNQTQISGCVGQPTGNLCTFDALEHVVNNNNVLSLDIQVDIVRHPGMPDRDLYIFDTAGDQLVEVVEGVGTLLYGIAVDSSGQVFVAQAEARNDANGKAGTLNHGLAEMENRAFLNRITRIDCSGGDCGVPGFIELEPLPPEHPEQGVALATPFAIQVSDDDSTLVATAAGSDMLFTLDANSGAVLGRVEVESVPRGIALESTEAGAPLKAWVLNAVANSVSLVDVSNPAAPVVNATIALDDPTPGVLKRGRMAFNDANASTTGTFSCESCHPDGHTDQLAWILDTPLCSVAGCNQIPPRITMPARGLRDTAPYHWDGIPGDPIGGNNTANIFGFSQPNCSLNEPESCTRFLADGSLASTMCMTGACPENDEGKQGALSAAERDDLAEFLLNIPYPPAPSRAYDNVLSELGKQGFRVFHIDGVFRPGDPTGPQPNVCGSCHRMPFLVSTNSPGTGMDAPTWRGAYDRWLVLPQGRTNLVDLLSSFQRNNGIPERSMWVRDGPTFEPVWYMIVEGSTGHSGSFARQVTLNQSTAESEFTEQMLDALELSAQERAVVLAGEGVVLDGSNAGPLALRFEPRRLGGEYVNRNDLRQSFTRLQLVNMARDGELVMTLTARLGDRVGPDRPQPGIWTGGPTHAQNGPVTFPTLSPESTLMTISGRHVHEGAGVFVDGRRVAGHVDCLAGELPDCSGEAITVELASLPEPAGVHFMQVQNRDGLFSNDFIFHSETIGQDNCPDIPNPQQLDADDDGQGDRCDDSAFDFDVTPAISGNWYDPSHDGEGWFVEILDDERALVYWFTHTPPGVDGSQAQAWIGGIGQINGSSIVVAASASEITNGAVFGPDFDPDRVARHTWGKFVLSFSSCDSGVMYYQSDDLDYGSGSLNLNRLTSISGLECGGPAEPPPPSDEFQVTAATSGAWYDPSHDGEGWLLEILPDGRALLAWFSYDPAGRQAWFYNVGTVSGNSISFELLQPAGSDFGPTFDPAEVQFPPWGSVTFAFDSCDSGTMNFESQIEGYGSGALNLTRLTRLAGTDCAP